MSADNIRPDIPGNVASAVNKHVAWAEQMARTEQAAQFTMSNNTIKMLADLATGSLFGRTSAQLQGSGSLVDQILGHAAPMAAAYGADLMGLSPASMIAAAQNTANQGGMRLRSLDGHESISVMGGPAGHRLADAVMGGINSRFFQGPGDALNLATTYGASREDIAAVTQDMQRRGAFSGNIGGTFETLTPERLGQLRSSAQGNPELQHALQGLSAGDQFVTPDAGLGGKVADKIQEALRSVSALREIMGNLKPQELFSELERLTGVDVSFKHPGSLNSAMTNLNMRVAQGAAAGLDARTTMELGAATTATMDSMMAARTGQPAGSFYGGAGALTGISDRYALSAWRENQSAGGYRNISETMATTAGDMARIFTETPEMLEAAVGASGMKAGAGRDSLMASIDAFGKAGTVSARESARRDMARVYEQTTGMRSGALTNAYGMDTLTEHLRYTSPEMFNNIGEAAMGSNQAAMIGDFRQAVGTYGNNSSFSRALGGPDRTAQFAMEMFQNIRGDKMQALMGGDMSALQGVNLPSFGSASNAFQYANARIQGASGGSQNVNDFLQGMNLHVQASPRLSALTSNPALQGQSTATSNYLRQRMGGMQAPLTISQQIEQGWFGGEGSPLENEQLLKYAGANDKDSVIHFDTNRAGGMETGGEKNSKALAELLKKSGVGGLGGMDIYKELKVAPGDDRALTEALKKPENASKVQSWLKESGTVMGLNEKGGVDILKDQDKARADYNKEFKGVTDKAKGDKGAGGGGPLTLNISIPGLSQFVAAGEYLFGKKK